MNATAAAAVSVADLAAQLSRQQRAALRLGAQPGARLYRNRGRFGRAPQSVSLDVAGSLAALGLMRVVYAARMPELVLTGNGRIVEAVLSERARRRSAP